MDGWHLGPYSDCWVSPFPRLRSSLTVFLAAVRMHLTFPTLLCNPASHCSSNQWSPGRPGQTRRFPHRPLIGTHSRTQPVPPIDTERVYPKCFFLQGPPWKAECSERGAFGSCAHSASMCLERSLCFQIDQSLTCLLVLLPQGSWPH